MSVSQDLRRLAAASNTRDKLKRFVGQAYAYVLYRAHMATTQNETVIEACPVIYEDDPDNSDENHRIVTQHLLTHCVAMGLMATNTVGRPGFIRVEW